MKEAFNLVRGAVSEKDLIPVLTHFAIEANRIHGFNGRIHISAPWKFPDGFPSFTVPANLLMAAMDACGEVEPSLHLQEAERRLIVSAGKFQAHLPIGNIAEYPVPIIPPAPVVKPSRKKLKDHPGGLLPVLETLLPFIGEDASRPWCASIRFQEGHAYATNNVVLAALPLPANMLLSTCALPVYAVQELLRIGREPKYVREEPDSALVFYLPGDVWLKTNLIADGWPDVAAVLEHIHNPPECTPQWIAVEHPELLEAVNAVAPFCPDPKLPAIVLEGDRVTTRAGVNTAAMEGFSQLEGTYHAKALQMVLEGADEVAWGCYPKVPWRGAGGLKGALVGLKT